MAKIFIIIGKSATGKDTIYKHLLEIDELKLKEVVMYTTRPIRTNETEGVEYHFVEEAKLWEFKKENKVIEHRAYNTVYGKWHYFTVNDGQIELQRYNYLMIGTLEAFQQIRKYYGEDKVVPIYLEVEDGTRILRAFHREQKQLQPKYAEMCRRYLADEEDFSDEKILELGITKRYKNDEVKLCLEEIKADIKNFTVLEKDNVI